MINFSKKDLNDIIRSKGEHEVRSIKACYDVHEYAGQNFGYYALNIGNGFFFFGDVSYTTNAGGTELIQISTFSNEVIGYIGDNNLHRIENKLLTNIYFASGNQESYFYFNGYLIQVESI